jgi:hypothetical protein
MPHPEDGGNKFLRNVDIYVPTYLSRYQYTHPSLWIINVSEEPAASNFRVKHRLPGAFLLTYVCSSSLTT